MDAEAKATTLTSKEARELTGRSATSLYAERTREIFAKHGVKVSETPKHWEIPLAALVEAGWFNADGSPRVTNTNNRPRRRNQSFEVPATLPEIAPLMEGVDGTLEKLTGELESVRTELKNLKKLQARESELSAAVAENKAHSKALHAAYDRMEATALEEAEADAKAAAERLAAVKKLLSKKS